MTTEQRVSRLERELRWSRSFNLLAVGGVAWLLLTAEAPKPADISAPVVTTQKLRIVDEQGRARANFFATGEEVFLLVGDATGKPRIGVKAKNAEDATLFFAGPDGEAVSTLTVNASGWLVKRNF